MDVKTCFDIIADICNIIIGFLTVFLAFYVFVYQKNKDKTDAKSQWVKELIINPHFVHVTNFYSALYALKDRFRNSDLIESEKIEILDLTKSQYYFLRESFISLLQFVEPKLYADLCDNIEKLIDNLADVVDNEELKLNLENVYNANFKKYIDKSYEMAIKTLFSYDGKSIG